MPIQESAVSPPGPLQQAVLRTLLYADVFDFPMSDHELQYGLIGGTGTLDDIRLALHGPGLANRVACHDGWWHIRGREAICRCRAQRERASAELWRATGVWAARVARLPFVRMVAVTGSLAVRNAEAHDDIDLLIATAPGRVWLARGFVIALVRVARHGGIGLCPNYVLSERALLQTRRSMYIAHDLVHMVPVYGFALHQRMRAENAWTRQWLPQAVEPRQPLAEICLSPRAARAKALAEVALRGRAGTALERAERSIKMRRFATQAGQAGSAALLDADHVKGHFRDHGASVMTEYNRRLTEHELGHPEPVSISAPPPPGPAGVYALQSR